MSSEEEISVASNEGVDWGAFFVGGFEEQFIRSLQGVRVNDPNTKELEGRGADDFVQYLGDEVWEEIGTNISRNTYLKYLNLYGGAINDHKMTFLFRGLTESTSIKRMRLTHNGLSATGVQSMGPFLQNATNLHTLDLDYNSNIQSEGFNILLRALSDSPVEDLSCIECGIESIEIDNYFPRNLVQLDLTGNEINTDGCRGIAQLLQAGDSTLVVLRLDHNNINDEGVAVLADALKRNTSLTTLNMRFNDAISKEGLVLLLKLVNDVSSFEATLQSNHTLTDICLRNILDDRYDDDELTEAHREFLGFIDTTMIAVHSAKSTETIGKEKIYISQLDSKEVAALAEFQGVNRSVYSEINPLHLPEVLSLVHQWHGRKELYVALKSCIAELMSTVNREQWIEEQMAYHTGKLEALRADLAAIKSAKGAAVEAESDGVFHGSKRRRIQG